MRRTSSSARAPRRALKSCNENVAPRAQQPKSPAKADSAKFFIKGIQGQLDVCERRSIKVHGTPQSYLLVRLRGQSNTLPNDATLSVNFTHTHSAPTVDVHFARVRLKAGELKYDFLPEPCTLKASPTNAKLYEATLLGSVFSKKCWQGMVVRGPRMFVAFVGDGSKRFHSVPMFVEISPTSNSPEYRDPVVEYPANVIDLFFSKQTVSHVFDKHTGTVQKASTGTSSSSRGRGRR